MLLGLIRFCRGTVEFEVKDGYLERFLSLCGKNGVPLWGIRRRGGSLTAKTSLAGGKYLRKLAAKSGVTLTLGPRAGAPAILRRYRLRAGLFAGGAVLLILPFLLSFFLWRIEITGNETIPTGELLSSLQELGVRRGVLRGKLDAREVERQMMLREERLSWIAVNLRGSAAHVEVRERDIAPPRVDTLIPHNIVAEKDGYIVHMEVYEGQPFVQPGDGVLAGDILVSGILEDGNGKNRTVHARARVEAQVKETLSVTVPYRRTVYRETGQEERRELHLFSAVLPLGKDPPRPWRVNAVKEPIPLVSRLLPVWVERRDYTLLTADTEEISPEAARAEASRLLEAEERKAFGSGSILSRELTGQELPDAFLLFGDYLCREDIAGEREILLEAELPLSE